MTTSCITIIDVLAVLGAVLLALVALSISGFVFGFARGAGKSAKRAQQEQEG